MLWSRPRLAASLVLLFLACAVAARADGGSLLRLWDEPVQQAVAGGRSPALDTFFRSASRLGSSPIVYVVGLLTAVVAAFRCRKVAVIVLLATVGRPFIEYAVKALVGRDRPGSDQMIRGRGPSFPSGHVLASMALYGLIPVVVALYTHRRAIWWAAVGLSGAVIVAVAASRVYLGVHWVTDVSMGLVFGAIGLASLDRLLERTHRRGQAAAGPSDADRRAPAGAVP
jgi:undecaprenyl-diphosphatase